MYINSTSGHVVAKFSTEPWKKTLIVAKCRVHWLNWTNAIPFRLHGPSNNPPFLTIFMFFADLNLLHCQAWVVTQEKVLRVPCRQSLPCELWALHSQLLQLQDKASSHVFYFLYSAVLEILTVTQSSSSATMSVYVSCTRSSTNCVTLMTAFSLTHHAPHNLVLNRPFAHTNSYFYSFVPYTISFWNNLDSSLVCASSVSAFKCNLHFR